MVSRNVTIKNASGLHLRPTGMLCNEAIKYLSSVKFTCRNNLTNAKSVLSVLGACIKCGDEIEFVCEGPMRRKRLRRWSVWWKAASGSKERTCGA